VEGQSGFWVPFCLGSVDFSGVVPTSFSAGVGGVVLASFSAEFGEVLPASFSAELGVAVFAELVAASLTEVGMTCFSVVMVVFSAVVLSGVVVPALSSGLSSARSIISSPTLLLSFSFSFSVSLVGGVGSENILLFLEDGGGPDGEMV